VATLIRKYGREEGMRKASEFAQIAAKEPPPAEPAAAPAPPPPEPNARLAELRQAVLRHVREALAPSAERAAGELAELRGREGRVVDVVIEVLADALDSLPTE
jgi:hypothetical protein